MNSFFELAKSPDCLFALRPDAGGRLYSGFQLATYRNFSVGMTWTNATTFYKATALDDIRIKYIFNFRRVVANRAFMNGAGLSGYASSDGTVGVIGGSIVSNALSYTFTPRINTTYEVIIERVGGVFKIYFNGVNVVTRTGGTYVDLSAVTGNFVSEHDGAITYFRVDNLTKGTFWQATDALLKNTDAVYPSAVPRNFSTETSAWQDFNIVQKNADWTHDYTFEIDFENEAKEGSVFYSGVSSSMFGVYQYADSRLYAFIKLIGATANSYHFFVIRNGTNGFLLGRHSIKYVLVGNTCYCYLDGALIGTATLIRQDKPVTLDRPVSNCGYVYRISLKDDTTNKQLFSYPNFEEEKRLITKVNTYTDNGYFQGAYKAGAVNVANVWGVKTALNLRYVYIDSTIYTRVYFGGPFAPGVASQQFALYSTVLTLKLRQETNNVMNMSVSIVVRRTDTGASHPMSASFTAGPEYMNRWLDIAIRISSADGTLSLYVDGVFKASATIPAYAKNTVFYNAADAFLVIGNTGDTGACRQDLAMVEKVLFLSRVLSEGQIRSFSADLVPVLDIDITTVGVNEEVVVSDSTTALTSDLLINWGDGTSIERVVRTSTNYTKISHIYVTPGNYKIAASGRLSISHANGDTKAAWRKINRFDMVRMGFVSANYAFQAKNLTAFTTPLIFPEYIKSCLSTFLNLGCDIPPNTTLPPSNTIAYGLFNQSKITRIRNGLTFGNIQSSGNSFAYLCYGCTELVEVEDGVKYPASLTASATTQTAFHYSGCRKLEHLSVNLFDDLNMDNLSGNALRDFTRECVKLKNLPNNTRFSAILTDLTYFALNCYELVWDITDKFPVFPNGSTIGMTSSFAWCSKITGYVDPMKLWKREDITWSKTDAFKNCTSLTNYDEIPASWGGLATVSISTNRTWTDVWGDKTVTVVPGGVLTCVENKGVVNIQAGGSFNVSSNPGTINYVSGSILNGVVKTENGTLTGSL